jgi:DNA-binding transcriptional LysR family regulator
MLTQPAVTRQVASLEGELRTRLLERLKKEVKLTSAGEALLPYAVEMLRLSGEARRVVADVESGASGRFIVGASSTAATYLLPPLLRRYREAYPGVDLSVSTGVSARVTEMVLAHAVDIGVVTEYGEQKGLKSIPLADHTTVAVVYPDHPLARYQADSSPRPIRVEELAESALLLMQRGTHLRAYTDRLFSGAAVEGQVSMELDNVEAIKKMIEARLGVSLLPLVSVEAEVEGGRLVALPLADAPGTDRRIAAIYREDKYLSTALKEFLRVLQSE